MSSHGLSVEADRATTFSFDAEEEERNCLLAVPKKGRLYEKVSELLKGTGLDFVRPNRLDVAHCTSLPLTLVFLPAADIAKYVGEGNVDIGITGQDVVQESQVEVEEIMGLSFGSCKLCVQAPISSKIQDASQLSGKRIVTSFPNLARQFFDQYDTEQRVTHIKYVSGSVEAACGLGLADAVVDLVETGTTMKAAGLEVVADIIRTESVVIVGKECRHPEMVATLKKRIEGYMTAQSYMMITYNVNKVNLETVLAITPGKRSPTISPLSNMHGGSPRTGQHGEDSTEWLSVSSLVKKKEANTIMDQLEAAGATDILLMVIHNSRM
jgi:ATP phosphoribosyltransferase